ncbi:hypothetical protein COT82_00925 [Candidatus Campbellbacteria bacterium CG10_big_fil_rev_8_21_14_0_10_35_52]|uniref:Type II secretion system protein n=1 Tax=Candidatus Campbellbacteria bacterium CG10_big_fil_rev_8_21_14_0_10_35_52 TaxID=1974527 RepID=A0A2M6WVN6_9BACT|nr:MAG: hypothetical protein COT82_00925 [Candidatus Campbellbacteria bacterium CG10_big_fil_rev_8_21_14_0_10_35_52]
MKKSKLQSKIQNFSETKKIRLYEKKGFTLIEMLVAVSLFVFVMLIGVGTLLSIIDANRKARALSSVMNNLNFALESISRNIRMGTKYHCEENTSVPPNIDTPKDCNPGKLFAFEASGGNPLNPNDQIIYRINYDESGIEMSKNGGANFVGITAKEVVIENFSFYVSGSSMTDNYQPKVVITIKGFVGVKEKIKTEFNLQTMVSQRVLDI